VQRHQRVEQTKRAKPHASQWPQGWGKDHPAMAEGKVVRLGQIHHGEFRRSRPVSIL